MRDAKTVVLAGFWERVLLCGCLEWLFVRLRQLAAGGATARVHAVFKGTGGIVPKQMHVSKALVAFFVQGAGSKAACQIQRLF